MLTKTTILGVEYPGRPMMGSLACSIYLLELNGKHSDAEKLLNAHNRINRAFGYPDVDLTDDMTTLPQEGLIVVPAGKNRGN
jgi:hypothetical protein